VLGRVELGGQFAVVVVVEALPGVPAFVLPGGVVDPAEFVVEPGAVPAVVDPVVVPEGQGPETVFVVDEPGVVVLGVIPGEVDGLVVCPGVVVVLWLGVAVVVCDGVVVVVCDGVVVPVVPVAPGVVWVAPGLLWVTAGFPLVAAPPGARVAPVLPAPPAWAAATARARPTKKIDERQNFRIPNSSCTAKSSAVIVF